MLLTHRAIRITVLTAVVAAALCVPSLPTYLVAPLQAQATSSPALPQIFLDTTYNAPASVTTLTSGSNLQTALNNATLGSTIVLPAGVTFTGNFTLPNKSGSGWIYVISSSLASMTAGNRVGPGQASLMPKIVTTTSDPAMNSAGGAHHFRFAGIEIATTWNTTSNTQYGLVSTDASPAPHDITFDRCYIHGTSNGNIRRGIVLGGASIAIVDSYISEIHEVGADSQAIGGWTGNGPYKIVNNYLSGAGENVMFGGATPPSVSTIPSDIEIRGNYFFKPLSWKNASWTIKNLLEFKNSQRVLVEGNIFENNWLSAQNGFSVLITPRAESGSAAGAGSDITIRRNRLINCAQGFNLSGEDDSAQSQRSSRVLLRDNVIDVVGTGSDGRVYQVTHGPVDLAIDHNTSFTNGMLSFNENSPKANRFSFTNNIAEAGDGFGGTGTANGTSTLDGHFSNYSFAKNAIFGISGSGYPTGNFYPASASAVGFVDLAGGDYTLAASSAYRSAGTDGQDLGANISLLNAATACTITGQCSGITGGSDVTPPTVSMTAPANGATLSGTVTVSANASDDTGVVGVQFKANGSNIGSEVLTAPYSVSWNSASVADGSYNITATARDAAGNVNTSSPMAVTVANSAPVISAVSASGVTGTSATISWTTNQASDSQVDYGATTAYGSSTTLNASLVTSHSQGLSGLTGNATYHYRVRSKNGTGQQAVSGDFTFVAVAPPAISAVASSGVTNVAATITWTTDQPSDSQVDYGTSTSYGSSTTLNTSMVTSHSVALSALTGGNTYHFRVRSRNAQGGLATSADSTFTTATAPTISAVSVSGITGTAATVTWTTNQTSDSQVDYGTTTTYGTSTTIDATQVTSHSQGLGPLTPGTTYHYRVKSRNSVGLLATSADATFVTLSGPTISGVSASGITSTAANINWSTNPSADTQVDYGTTTAYSNSTTLVTTLVTAHTQPLAGLAAGTTYHYRVKSRNSFGLLTTSGDFTFATVAPPVISAVAVPNKTSTSATVTWTTNQTADSQVEYGATTAYGSSTALDALLVTSHSRVISGLTASTTYHFRAKSRNASGLLTNSADSTFTTSAGPTSTYSLAVSLTGPGVGAVIGPIAGISCGTTCSGSVNAGTSVTLTALPGAASRFAGWSGACSGNSLTCTVIVNAASSVTASFAASVTGDFDGDGFADLIWQNTDGTLALWTMQGASPSSVNYVTPLVDQSGTDWQIIGPTSGSTGSEDSGAGSTGPGGFVHATGGGVLSAVYLTPQSRIVDTDWQIVATPDLNGDGKADLLWQHSSSGKLAAWLMNGSVKTFGSFLTPDSSDPNSGWQIRTAGDFNGDGKADILWQQAGTGQLKIWLMNGTTRLSEQTLAATVSTQWRLAGSGDFDADGQRDLVWQNDSTGDVYVWLMTGTTMRVEVPVGKFSAGWLVRSVGDFDADGRPDLVWQKSTGELAVWFMNGTTVKSTAYLTPGSVDPSWKIVGVK